MVSVMFYDTESGEQTTITDVTITLVRENGRFDWKDTQGNSMVECNPDIVKIIDSSGNFVSPNQALPVSDIEKLKQRQSATEDAVLFLMMTGGIL